MFIRLLLSKIFNYNSVILLLGFYFFFYIFAIVLVIILVVYNIKAVKYSKRFNSIISDMYLHY